MSTQLKVQELRDALTERGLDTIGTKAVLVARLDAYENDNASKNQQASMVDDRLRSGGKKAKVDPEEASGEKDIDGYTVVKLRAALAKRGISTAGTKKILQSRLSEALNGKIKDKNDDCQKNDGEEQSEEENIVVSIKKGRAVLDNHLPVHLKSGFHVLESDQDIYDAMLSHTNVRKNSNKFYVIQVLESDNGSGQYYVFNRWGRVGAKGRVELVQRYDKKGAIINFEHKFYHKTKNTWALRANFQPVRNKYTWLERDYSDDAKALEPKSKDVGKFLISKHPTESKLESRLAKFVSCICSNNMKQQIMEIGYDANKLPLGKLSKATILKGYDTLKRIAAVLDGSATGSLEGLSSAFYTVIPHNFGFQRIRKFTINTNAKLRRKLALVEALGEIQLTTKLLEEDEEEDDPLYSSYRRLKCQLEPLEHDSEEFIWIKRYVNNTHAKTHSSYGLEVLEVFKTSREGEEDRFKKFADVQNRMLLWHGSRLTNWTKILSQGLRITPPEAPITGLMFGEGVYFSDMVSKSANYCGASSSNPIGVLLLCEVALGDMNELELRDKDAGKLPPGKLSTKGVGGTEPNRQEFKFLPDGLIVPMGKPVQKVGHKGPLLYNEYIVYNVEQICMRYVLQVKFHFK